MVLPLVMICQDWILPLVIIVPKLDPSFGDNLPELDPTSKILHNK